MSLSSGIYIHSTIKPVLILCLLHFLTQNLVLISGSLSWCMIFSAQEQVLLLHPSCWWTLLFIYPPKQVSVSFFAGTPSVPSSTLWPTDHPIPDLPGKHCVHSTSCRGIVCVENCFVKSDLRLKPLSVERTFSVIQI